MAAVMRFRLSLIVPSGKLRVVKVQSPTASTPSTWMGWASPIRTGNHREPGAESIAPAHPAGALQYRKLERGAEG